MLKSSSVRKPRLLSSDPVTLVVTCHEEYASYLRHLLRVWEELTKELDWNLVLALDGFSYAPVSDRWEVIEGKWGTPSGGRQEAIRRKKHGWVLYWDADNIPTEDWVEAVEFARKHPDREPVGIFFSEVTRIPIGQMEPRYRMCVDTASLWRIEAVHLAGGWDQRPEIEQEDWVMSIKVAEMGWRLHPLGVRLNWADHGKNRSKNISEVSRFLSRDVGVIVPMRGDSVLAARWARSFADHHFPPDTGLTIVDTSDSAYFARYVDTELIPYLQSNAPLRRVTHITCPPAPSARYHDIHRCVGRAFNVGFRCSPESLILTWEDDVYPENPATLRNLIPEICPLGPFDVAGALVPDREIEKRVIAAIQKDRWVGMPSFDECREKKKMLVGMLGGGFTLFNRMTLHQIPFFGPTLDPEEHSNLGWDGFLFRRINNAGRKVLLRCDLPCVHDQVRYE